MRECPWLSRNQCCEEYVERLVMECKERLERLQRAVDQRVGL